MKIIYSVLFFTGVLLFFGLVYAFIKILNSETNKFMTSLVFVAIVACISSLTYLLYKVMNSDDSNNENLF